MFTIDEFIEAKRLGKPHTGKPGAVLTLKTYESTLRQAEALLDKSVHEMREGDDEALLEVMDEEGLATTTKNKVLSALRMLFRWAIGTRRYTGVNPFEAVGHFTIHADIPLILTREQVDTLLAKIEETRPKYGLFFRLMAYCGLRISEVCAIRRADIREDGLVVRGKGSKQRIVPLPESVKERLGRQLREEAGEVYLFEGRYIGEPMTTHFPTEVFRRAITELGMNPELTPHNLRHSCATLFHAATGDLAITQDFLGHASPLTTRRYAQITQEQMKSAHSKVFN